MLRVRKGRRVATYCCCIIIYLFLVVVWWPPFVLAGSWRHQRHLKRRSHSNKCVLAYGKQDAEQWWSNRYELGSKTAETYFRRHAELVVVLGERANEQTNGPTNERKKERKRERTNEWKHLSPFCWLAKKVQLSLNVDEMLHVLEWPIAWANDGQWRPNRWSNNGAMNQ